MSRRRALHMRQFQTSRIYSNSPYSRIGQEVYWLLVRYSHEKARIAALPMSAPYRQERLDAHLALEGLLAGLLEKLASHYGSFDEERAAILQVAHELEEWAGPGYVPPTHYAPGAAGVAKLREMRAGCKVYAHAARDLREIVARSSYPKWSESEFYNRAYARNGRLIHPPVPVRPRTVAKQLAARQRAGRTTTTYEGGFLDT